ncbi:MAG: hypothetical protein N2447_00635 [Thermoanaerobaculum sp.]|nr:hypothetical protein [Thermoanaerobaculum sp.]
MNVLAAEHFFNLEGFRHRSLFPADEPVWAAVAWGLAQYLQQWSWWEIRSPLPAGVHLLSGPVYIDEDVEIEPGAVLRGPVLLDRGCRVRAGAYLRGPVLCGEGAVVGAHSELKNAVLLPHAHAPHQNYVGDSILGCRVNLGAGTILSNFKHAGDEVVIKVDGRPLRTGLRKLGAILGDGCKTGCNTVTNPGVLMGPGCLTYPNATLASGYYPPGAIVKVRQTQQLIFNR